MKASEWNNMTNILIQSLLQKDEKKEPKPNGTPMILMLLIGQ